MNQQFHQTLMGSLLDERIELLAKRSRIQARLTELTREIEIERRRLTGDAERIMKEGRALEDQEILYMRATGSSFKEIGKRFGLPEQRAAKRYRAALKLYGEYQWSDFDCEQLLVAIEDPRRIMRFAPRTRQALKRMAGELLDRLEFFYSEVG